MNAPAQTEYIVQCVREAGSMYEKDARAFLAEHDGHVRTAARNDAADWLAAYPFPADTTDWARGRTEGVAWTVGILRNPDPQRGDEGGRPGFFRPGHTYQHSDWSFRCDAVTTHPDSGERTAIGWFRFRDDAWRIWSADLGLWSVAWTDVTEAGTR